MQGGLALKVKSVKKMPKANTYNMQVADTHNFAITEKKVIVSNCDALRYACQANLRPAVFSFE